MLEENALVIDLDSSILTETKRACWPILHPVTEEWLGSFRWHASPWFGLSWCSGRSLEVREAEDEPLLMTRRRPWGIHERWMVYDAESHLIGYVDPRRIVDSRHHLRAKVEIETDPPLQTFFDLSGESLGAFELLPGRALLQFEEQALFNPFTRMLLLSCAVTRLISQSERVRTNRESTCAVKDFSTGG